MTNSANVIDITSCNICGSKKMTAYAHRSDGLNVLICEGCGMGVLEKFPNDPSVFYGDDYYINSDSNFAAGYHNYDLSSEHGVLWASEVLKATLKSGRVLDIGCANAFLLNSLGGQYEAYGIEANGKAAIFAESTGVIIIGNDILDSTLLENYSGYFDAITAIAVFEHVIDFRGAIEASLRLLKPDGVMIFEVPLISETNNNDAWLTSSLEHLFYPTIKGISYLFEVELKKPMAGRELVIQDYASTFIGIVANDKSVLAGIELDFDQMFSAPSSNFPFEIRRAQMLLNIIHAANSKIEYLEFVHELFPTRQNIPFLSRCLDLWRADAARLKSLRDYLVKVEEARSWHAERATLALSERDAALSERDAALSERYFLYRSKSWCITKALKFAQSVARFFEQKWLKFFGVCSRLLSLRRLTYGFSLLIRGEMKALKLEFCSALRNETKKTNKEATLECILPSPLDNGQPLVSVIIPCFNYGKFVVEAIDSVLAQTLANIEVIVIDGGSTDNETLEILKTTQRPRTRILFRDGRHLVGDNRNYGIGLARGRYICCLDADDTLDATYLEKAVFYLETYGYDIVSTATNFVGARKGHIDYIEYPDLTDMTNGNHVLTCAVFRKHLWAAVGGYVDTGIGQDHVAEDWDFWLRLAANGARIRNISREYLFNYRIHDGSSLSSSADVKPLSVQREEILHRNIETLTRDAHAFSIIQQSRRLRCDPAQTALASCADHGSHRITLLLAMPYFLIGGAERLLSGLCAYLNNQGWRVIVIKTLPQESCHGTSIDWFKSTTSEVYALPDFLDPAEQADFLVYLLASRHVDCILNTGSRLVYELLPSIKKSNPNLTFVDLLFNTVGHVKSHLEFKDHISYAFAENQEVFDWYKNVAGWPVEQLAKLSSGVDLKRLSPKSRPKTLVEKFGIDTAELVVGFSGRLSEEKGPDIFVEVAKLCQRIPNLRFVMTGAGRLDKDISKKIKALPAAVRFEYAGLVDDVDQYLALYDLLILPSRIDGRPLVVMEALACGVPVIASDVGGLHDLIDDGKCGFLVPPANAKAITDCIILLAGDRSLLADLKIGARKQAEEKLDADLAFSHYETAILKAIGTQNLQVD
jgi:glycosyltransferase involved in cell wall biosynthesis/SAM-dependent methyltransferase